MAFLDNSGDIILDAVLTDTGRMRLAKGDGSFKVTKFALGDDVINYRLYRNQNNPLGAHSSGSAFYDLEILQTPVLEAFTNNTSLLKYRLVTYARNDILYLPVFELNKKNDVTNTTAAGAVYVVAVDNTTAANATNGLDAGSTRGVLNGFAPKDSTHYIRMDIGLNTLNMGLNDPIDQDLYETQLIVELDNRLGTLVNGLTNAPYQFDFLDDDQVATYVLTGGDVFDQYSINPNATKPGSWQVRTPQAKVGFKFLSSTSLRTSDALFNQFGTSDVSVAGSSAETYSIIDTIVRVSGGNTGFSLDIPVRFAKYTG